MYKFFDIKGTFMDVSDEIRSFSVKYKNGVSVPGQMDVNVKIACVMSDGTCFPTLI